MNVCLCSSEYISIYTTYVYNKNGIYKHELRVFIGRVYLHTKSVNNILYTYYINKIISL